MGKTLACTLSLLFLAPMLLGAQSGAGTLASDPRVATALELIELWMDAQVDYDDIPGVSMGIVYDQDLIWSKGFGYSHVETEIPAAPNTIYSICSISKLFTSIGLMQLRDEGLLRLDDPIVDHLPWFTICKGCLHTPPVCRGNPIIHTGLVLSIRSLQASRSSTEYRTKRSSIRPTPTTSIPTLA